MLLKKIKTIEDITDITDLATTTTTTTTTTATTLNAVENKMPNVSNFVKRTDYNTKISEIETKINGHNHDQYIISHKFDKLIT